MNAGGGGGASPLSPQPLAPAATATDDILSVPTSDRILTIGSVLQEQTHAREGVEKLVAEQRVQIDVLRSKLRAALGRLDRQRELFRCRERELRAIYEEDLCQLDEDYRRAYRDVANQQREALNGSLQRATLFGSKNYVRDGQQQLTLPSVQLSPRLRPTSPITRVSCPATLSKAVQASWSYATRRNASTNTDNTWTAATTGSSGNADRQALKTAGHDSGSAILGGGVGGGLLHQELLRTVAEASAWTRDLAARLGLVNGAVEQCTSQLEQATIAAARRTENEEAAKEDRKMKEESNSNKNDDDSGAEKADAPPIARRRPLATLPNVGAVSATENDRGRRQLSTLQSEQLAAASVGLVGEEESEQGEYDAEEEKDVGKEGLVSYDEASLVRNAGAAAAARDAVASDESLRLMRWQQHVATTTLTAADASPNSCCSAADDESTASQSPTSCASVDSLECVGDGATEELVATEVEPFPPKSSDSLERFAEHLLASYPRAAPAK